MNGHPVGEVVRPTSQKRDVGHPAIAATRETQIPFGNDNQVWGAVIEVSGCGASSVGCGDCALIERVGAGLGAAVL